MALLKCFLLIEIVSLLDENLTRIDIANEDVADHNRLHSIIHGVSVFALHVLFIVLRFGGRSGPTRHILRCLLYGCVR